MRTIDDIAVALCVSYLIFSIARGDIQKLAQIVGIAGNDAGASTHHVEPTGEN